MGRRKTGEQFFDHLTLIQWLGSYDGPPIPSEEIARQMTCHWETAKPWMQTLEKLGMVRSQSNPRDARRTEWVPLYNITQRELNKPTKEKPSLQAYLDTRGITSPKPDHMTQEQWDHVQYSVARSNKQNDLGGNAP